MPMQPSPRAEISRLLFPSLRFCIIEFLRCLFPEIDQFHVSRTCPKDTMSRIAKRYTVFSPFSKSAFKLFHHTMPCVASSMLSSGVARREARLAFAEFDHLQLRVRRFRFLMFSKHESAIR